MTHPQWPPETLVGSFAQQVFSLMVSELWSGVKSSPAELLERPLLAAPQLVAGGETLARGSGNPSPSRRGCFGLPWSDGRGQPRSSDSGVISVTAIDLQQRLGRFRSYGCAWHGWKSLDKVLSGLTSPSACRALGHRCPKESEHPGSSIPALLGSHGMWNLPCRLSPKPKIQQNLWS